MSEAAKIDAVSRLHLAELRPVIKVVGVGGAGGNAINNMIASGLKGVDYVVANTDAQALAMSAATRRIQLGVKLTEGLGAGSRPDVGFQAAMEAEAEIRDELTGAHMVFIAAGMGGGTGTGAASVIARIAREMDILTVGIVTRPFVFEGSRRARVAEAGIAELRPVVDTLIVIPNQNLFLIANERTTFAEAFQLADRVLHAGVACIVDLIMKDGLINLDFADVRAVMSGMGTAVMGTGEASGPERARKAAEQALANPLLDSISLKGARGLLVSIIGGADMTLFEVDEAASRVRSEVDSDANIIVGASFDNTIADRIRVAVVAAGMSAEVTAATPAARAEPNTPVETEAPSVAPASSAASVGSTVSTGMSPTIAALAPAAPQPPPIPARGAQPPAFRSTPPPVPLAAPRQTWQAPHGVTIEVPARGHALPLPPSVPTPASASAAPARRMPEIDEFPAVAQREHAQKSQEYAGAASPPPMQPARIAAHSGADRAPSLLNRLVGNALGRSAGAANHESDTHKPSSPMGTSGSPENAKRVSGSS